MIMKDDDIYYMGIDPGASGGIAVLDASGAVLECVVMPDTPLEILSFLRCYDSKRCVCVLEDVGQGMPGQSSSATAKFARHNGHLEMALMALGIKTIKVRPQKWEKTYALGKSSAYGKAEWKRRLKERAQQLFPQLGKKVTLKTCDALLIAEFCRRSNI